MRRSPARTVDRLRVPHSNSTAGNALTRTLLTRPYFPTRARTLLAAIPGSKSCASTSTSTIAARQPPCDGALPTPHSSPPPRRPASLRGPRARS